MVQKQTSKKEFEKITKKIHQIIGEKFKDHKDGDYEELLFKEFK